MSSHREAPSISKDPVADNTDTYAFVSPDKPDTVTMIMNYIPGESPAGGPNFYEFGDDVLYEFVIDNDGERRCGHHVPVPVPHRRQEREHVPLQLRPDHEPDEPRLEPRPDVLRHPGVTDGHPEVARLRPASARRSTSARARRRTTPRSPVPPCTRCPTASRSSPASAVTASSSTWARSSTWATCVRSRTST